MQKLGRGAWPVYEGMGGRWEWRDWKRTDGEEEKRRLMDGSDRFCGVLCSEVPILGLHASGIDMAYTFHQAL